MVVSLLLARAGVDVTVLELLDELGLGERFNRLPQSRLTRVAFPVGDGRQIVVGDISQLRCVTPTSRWCPSTVLVALTTALAGTPTHAATPVAVSGAGSTWSQRAMAQWAVGVEPAGIRINPSC
jgi:hypothetical protein